MGKWGFFVGAASLALGASGEIVGYLTFETLPDCENTAFVCTEGLGIVIGFFAPLIFGIVFPLAESQAAWPYSKRQLHLPIPSCTERVLSSVFEIRENR